MGQREVSDEELLDDIREVGEAHGGTPSANKYQEEGEYSASLASARFGSWNDAVREAGFEPRRSREVVSDEDLETDITRVAGEVDGAPTVSEYEDHGIFSPSTVMQRFGSWEDALDRVDL